MKGYGVYEIVVGAKNLPELVRQSVQEAAEIRCPGEVVSIMRKEPFLMDRRDEERVYVIGVNSRKKVVGVSMISQGTHDASLVSTREVFMRLLMMGAKGFLMVHNHPGGGSDPSGEDIKVTQMMKEAGRLMSINLLDHIIMAEDCYYSFKERGMLV
mgnify:CR=1 FL=1